MLRFRYLLLLPAFFVVVSLCLYFISIAGLFPKLHNGAGLWLFASDAFSDHPQSALMADLLRKGNLSEWWSSYPVNIYGVYGVYPKVYSLFYFALGNSLLSRIPFTTAMYLFAVVMVFVLGKSLFNETVGFWSAVVVGLFPSFFLQATHSVKDSLYLGGQFLLMNALVLLTGEIRTKRVIGLILMNCLIGFAIVRMFRPHMMQITILFFAMALGVGLYRAIRVGGKTVWGFLAGIVLLVVFGSMFRFYGYGWDSALKDWIRGKGRNAWDQTSTLKSCRKRNGSDNGACLAGCWDRETQNSPYCWMMIVEHRRWKFRKTAPESGSRIDENVIFYSPGDIVRYIPRAIQIGFAAPFPNMWFSSGRATGRLGRLVAEVETGLMYVVLLLVVFGIWKEKRNPAVWLISLFVFCGVTLLGLVVINIGALYRHRYVFWFLLIILAIQGFNRLRERPPWSGRAGQERLD